MNKNIKIAMMGNTANQTMKVVNLLLPHVRVISNMRNLPSSEFDPEGWKFETWSKSGKIIYQSLKEWKLVSYSDLKLSDSEVGRLLNEALEEMIKVKEAFDLFQETNWEEGNPMSWKSYWNQLSSTIIDSSKKVSDNIIQASKYYKVDFSSKEWRKEYLKQRKRF